MKGYWVKSDTEKTTEKSSIKGLKVYGGGLQVSDNPLPFLHLSNCNVFYKMYHAEQLIKKCLLEAEKLIFQTLIPLCALTLFP
jgi:hypothetical protein